MADSFWAIRLAARRVGEFARIEVTDTGPGIPAAEQGRIFESFVRLQGEDSPKPGSGLGLAIARRLVELHGGEIGVGEGPEGGAVFHFTLPRHSEHARLMALVHDGVADDGAPKPRCLLLLQTGPEHDLALVEEQVNGILRRGVDRLTRLQLKGTDTLALALATHRDGALTFLARLESRLAADRRDAGPVTYALHEMGPDREDLPAGLEAGGFIRLDLGMVTRGSYNVPQTGLGD